MASGAFTRHVSGGTLEKGKARRDAICALLVWDTICPWGPVPIIPTSRSCSVSQGGVVPNSGLHTHSSIPSASLCQKGSSTCLSAERGSGCDGSICGLCHL